MKGVRGHFEKLKHQISNKMLFRDPKPPPPLSLKISLQISTDLRNGPGGWKKCNLTLT